MRSIRLLLESKVDAWRRCAESGEQFGSAAEPTSECARAGANAAAGATDPEADVAALADRYLPLRESEREAAEAAAAPRLPRSRMQLGAHPPALEVALFDGGVAFCRRG